MARIIEGSLCGALLFFCAPVMLIAAPTNLLVNPGFETGDFGGWTLSSNTEFGVALDGTAINDVTIDPYSPAFVNVRTGRFAGWALIQHEATGALPPRRLLLSQTLSVLPNTNVDVGFWLGNDSQSQYGVAFNDNSPQIFIDGVGLFPPSNGGGITPSQLPTGFFEIAGSFNTGPRSAINVQFAVNGSGSAIAGASFDDFFFNTEPAPEPPTILLTAIGGGGCLAMSRRKQKDSRRV
jgi:hypothetical protein